MAFVDQMLLSRAGSLVQTCERHKYAYILRHIGAKGTSDDRYRQVEPIDRAMEAITVEFSGRLQKAIEGLMADLASRIESARKMRDAASKKNVRYSSAEKWPLPSSKADGGIGPDLKDNRLISDRGDDQRCARVDRF
jgi:hypothetical protein